MLFRQGQTFECHFTSLQEKERTSSETLQEDASGNGYLVQLIFAWHGRALTLPVEELLEEKRAEKRVDEEECAVGENVIMVHVEGE